MRQRAETLRPFYGPPRGFSFAREIQPILDRHCVSCHDGRADVPYALTVARVEDTHAKRRWSESYLALTHARQDEAARGPLARRRRPPAGLLGERPIRPAACSRRTPPAPTAAA